MNAAFEFSGDRREVELDMSYTERKTLEREETRVTLEQATNAETTLLSAGEHQNDLQVSGIGAYVFLVEMH